jgi:hypothetical protein
VDQARTLPAFSFDQSSDGLVTAIEAAVANRRNCLRVLAVMACSLKGRRIDCVALKRFKRFVDKRLL